MFFVFGMLFYVMFYYDEFSIKNFTGKKNMSLLNIVGKESKQL